MNTARRNSSAEARATRPPKCLWSGRRDAGTRNVVIDPGPGFRGEATPVCPVHEAALVAFIRHTHRVQYRFLAGVGLVTALALVASLSERPALITLVVFCFGVVILAWPIATPQTVQLIGVRRSVLLVRGFGVAALAWGTWRIIALLV